MKPQRSWVFFLAISLFWVIMGFTWYSHGVRTVEVLGLFFSGAAFGASMTKATTLFRASRRAEF